MHSEVGDKLRQSQQHLLSKQFGKQICSQKSLTGIYCQRPFLEKKSLLPGDVGRCCLYQCDVSPKNKQPYHPCTFHVYIRALWSPREPYGALWNHMEPHGALMLTYMYRIILLSKVLPGINVDGSTSCGLLLPLPASNP